jgi:protein-L-isoaspartate(D-aspartate) O-methyltransferase
MQNFSTARTNMVDSQIHTAGVVSSPLLEAFRTVPRELFVPEGLRGLVYVDEDLPLGQGYFLMEPAVLARMLEAADIKGHDHILNVGDATGYSTAILSMIAKTVTTPDKVLQNETFSLIVLNGSVPEMPPVLLDHLAMQGRIVGIIKPPGLRMGTVTIMERIGDKHYSTRKLFEAGTPYIPGFEPESVFTF